MTDNTFLPVMNFSCLPENQAVGDAIKSCVLSLGGTVSVCNYGPDTNLDVFKYWFWCCRDGQLLISRVAHKPCGNGECALKYLRNLLRVKELNAGEFIVHVPEAEIFLKVQRLLFDIGYTWGAFGPCDIDFTNDYKTLHFKNNGTVFRVDALDSEAFTLPVKTVPDLEYMLQYLNTPALDMNAIFADKQNFRLRRPSEI